MAGLTADDIIRLLKLEPLAAEGGFFRETYRSASLADSAAVASRLTAHGSRPLSTAIFYLLTPETCSRLHRLPSDELFHFYLGDPVTMLQLLPDRTSRTVVLGHDLAAGMQVQVAVPAGVWQGCCLNPGGRFALMGTTVAPGFDRADYEAGERERLVQEYADRAALIRKLT